MEQILVVLFMLASVAMVALILMQHGKGADAGAAFGSGASATVFGAQGSANFLSRTTGVLAAGWFVLALTLAWYAMNRTEDAGLMDNVQDTPPSVEVPAPVSDLPDVPGTQPAGSDLPDVNMPKASEPSVSFDVPVPKPAADVPKPAPAAASDTLETAPAADVVKETTEQVVETVRDAAENAVDATAKKVEDVVEKAGDAGDSKPRNQ